MPIISGESGEFLSSFEPEPPRVAERVRGTLSRAGRFAPLPGGPRLSQGFIFHSLIQRLRGPVDQLEDRYLGMVEAVGSNPTRSTPQCFASGPEQPLERVAKSRRAHRDNGSCHRAAAAPRARPGLRVVRPSPRSAVII